MGRDSEFTASSAKWKYLRAITMYTFTSSRSPQQSSPLQAKQSHILHFHVYKHTFKNVKVLKNTDT